MKFITISSTACDDGELGFWKQADEEVVSFPQWVFALTYPRRSKLVTRAEDWPWSSLCKETCN